MKKIILPACLFLIAFKTSAMVSQSCPRKLESYSNIQVHQSLSGDGKKCYLSIHPRDAYETLIYRDYLFTSDGSLLIFNSLKPDEGPGSSGAREFFFFPDNFKGYAWEVVNQELLITGFNQLKIHFSLDSAQMTQIEGAEVQVSKEVNAKNQGGVEFLNPTWAYIDSGFLLGNAPSAEPRRNSTLKNHKQDRCVLQNQLIFNYLGDDSQIKSKAEINKISGRKCPGFTL